MPKAFRILVAALLVLPLLFAVTTAPAMAGSTQTGTIRGKVVDDKGQPVPGATILLRSEALIRERATVTDTEGNFFAPGLPTGKYQVLAQMAGYQTAAVITDVQVDKVTPVNLTLKEGEIVETVTVTGGRPVVSKTNTDTAKIVDRKQTDNLPVGRSYQSLIQFAPGVTGGSNPNMLGGTSNSNVYLADGVSIRDPVTGTFGSNMIFDAIEAVDIKLTGVSAEYGQFQGGLTNMITKSGGNTFTGSVRDLISQPNWTKLYSIASRDKFQVNRRRPTQAEGCPVNPRDPHYNDPNCWSWARPAIDQYTDGGSKTSNRIQTTLGGPIVTDNAWFFLAYDKNSSTGSGVMRTGYYTTFFDGDYAFGKGTWQVSNDHRVQFSYSRDPARTTSNYAAQFFGYAYDESNIDVQNQGGHLWVANWNAIWSPQIVTDVKIAKFQNGFEVTPLADPDTFALQPRGRDRNNQYVNGPVAPAYEQTTNTIYDANIFSSDPETRKREQYEGALTYFLDTKSLGTHTLKVGVDYSKQENVGSSIIQGNAVFYFNMRNTSGNPFDASNRDYAYVQDMALPSLAGPKNMVTTAYVQDDWQFNQNLAFNLGVRYEKNDNENDVGEKVVSDNSFAPRLGVAWDVTGGGKHIVKGTYAQYKAGINLTTLSPFVRAAGGQSSYNIRMNPYYGTAYNAPADTGEWPIAATTTPDTTAAQFAKNLKPQQINEWTIGYEYSMSPEFGVGVKYVDRKWDKITTVAYGYKPGTTQKTQFIFNNDDAKRSYKAWMLTAEKRLSHNWQMYANYTYSKAEGNVSSDSGFDTFESYNFIPETYVNRYGYLAWDVRNQAKIQGFYMVPLKSERHKLSVGGVINYASGVPYAKNNTFQVIVGPGADGNQDYTLGTVLYGSTYACDVQHNPHPDQCDKVGIYYEGRGAHTTPATKQVDLSVNYGYQMTKRVNFEARFDVFNVTNEQEVTGVSSTWYPVALSGSMSRANYLFGYPTANSNFQGTRGYRFQLALTW